VAAFKGEADIVAPNGSGHGRRQAGQGCPSRDQFRVDRERHGLADL